MPPRRLALLLPLFVLALSGCTPGGVVKATMVAIMGAPPEPDRSLSRHPDAAGMLLEGRIEGPAALGDGTRIVEEGYTRPFRVLQSAPWLPVEHAALFMRSARYEEFPYPGQYSDAEGRFAFPYAPPREAVFISAHIKAKGAIHRFLAFTRTGEVSEKRAVTVDAASTLVARQMLRLWQLRGYVLDLKSIAREDVAPLEEVLREQIRGGLPTGIELDLTRVKAPEGTWSLDQDRADSALVALDRLAAQSTSTRQELDRLYKAARQERPASL